MKAVASLMKDGNKVSSSGLGKGGEICGCHAETAIFVRRELSALAAPNCRVGGANQGLTLAVCSTVTLGLPLSQMIRGLHTRPPSLAICTHSCCVYTDTNSPMKPACRSLRMVCTKRTGSRWVPRMWPFSMTIPAPLHSSKPGEYFSNIPNFSCLCIKLLQL